MLISQMPQAHSRIDVGSGVLSGHARDCWCPHGVCWARTIRDGFFTHRCDAPAAVAGMIDAPRVLYLRPEFSPLAGVLASFSCLFSQSLSLFIRPLLITFPWSLGFSQHMAARGRPWRLPCIMRHQFPSFKCPLVLRSLTVLISQRSWH